MHSPSCITIPTPQDEKQVIDHEYYLSGLSCLPSRGIEGGCFAVSSEFARKTPSCAKSQTLTRLARSGLASNPSNVNHLLVRGASLRLKHFRLSYSVICSVLLHTRLPSCVWCRRKWHTCTSWMRSSPIKRSAELKTRRQASSHMPSRCGPELLEASF